MTPEEIIKKYSDAAKEYDKKGLDSGYIAHKKIALAVIDELRLKNAKVIDLGCGTGQSSVEFFNKGYEVTGLDITPGMLEEARKYSFEKLICQNLDTPLKVEDNKFDAAVLTGVMEFIQDPLVLFNEVNRVLKANGVFAITIPQKFPEGLNIPFKSYSKKDIEPVFKKAGFRIIRCEEFFGFRKWGSGEEIFYYAYVLRKD
ncbi:methyltransferase domain-containing protein [archaeon]|nr:methyltransferase domain-containing protein [archaeon]